MADWQPQPRTVYAVSELTEVLRGLIEDSLPRVWVEGEISNFSRPASGHWYFTLKDSRAQLRSVMFRNTNYLVRPAPRDGDQVRVRGQLSVYEARGDLQLICEHMEAAGQGALLLAFEKLKARLAAEGLFDAALKRPLPASPRAIGIITSATGAALQDVLSALGRRHPLATVYLYPVPVQGAEAAPAIVRALRELPELCPAEVVLLVRGGGSLEDLWAFNEETVARAIRACTLPVISGVGHEIDFTIADFVADLRAPTPTAAAELASPDLSEQLRQLDQLEQSIKRVAASSVSRAEEQLTRADARLRQLHPARRLQEHAQRLDDLDTRLQQNGLSHVTQQRDSFTRLQSSLLAARPLSLLGALEAQIGSLSQRLMRDIQFRLRNEGDRVEQVDALLMSFNPHAVLKRGYAIAWNEKGQALTDPAQLPIGGELRLQLAAGEIKSRRIS